MPKRKDPIEAIKKDIEAKYKKALEEFAGEMSYQVEAAYESVVQSFYDDYTPKYYDRTESTYKFSDHFDDMFGFTPLGAASGSSFSAPVITGSSAFIPSSAANAVPQVPNTIAAASSIASSAFIRFFPDPNMIPLHNYNFFAGLPACHAKTARRKRRTVYVTTHSCCFSICSVSSVIFSVSATGNHSRPVSGMETGISEMETKLFQLFCKRLLPSP